MDIGMVSVRYAKALLKFAIEQKAEDKVYVDMLALADAFIKVPRLRVVLENPIMKGSQIEKLLASAAGEGICPTTIRFIRLVVDHRRIAVIQFVARSYVSLYRAHKGIVPSRLTVSTPVSDDTSERLKMLLGAKTNNNIELELNIDPEIEGGFIIEYDTYRFDASLKTQLRNIRNQLLEASRK